MKRDQEIFDLIEKEHQRQLKGIELIASENFVSDEVMEAMGSYLTNKSSELNMLTCSLTLVHRPTQQCFSLC